MAYYALLSVSDKTGIVDFAEGLIRAGYTIISSGGTHAVLQAENQFQVDVFHARCSF